MKRLSLALLLGAALIGPAPAVVTSTPVGNASYTVLATDQRIVFTVSFSAPRTLTLPSAGASCIGQTCPANALEILDQVGVVSATNTLTLTPSGSETINNSTSSITIGEPFGRILLIPTNGSNWQLVIYAPGQYPGTTTNDLAVAGSIGEYVVGRTDALALQTATASVTAGGNVVTSAPLLTTNIPSNLTQLLLTAGDWDCRGQSQLGVSGSASATVFSAWTSTAVASSAPPIPSNLQDGVPTNPSFVALQAAAVVSPLWALGVPSVRYSLAASTSIYLNTMATFSAGTMTGMGNLACRRVR